MKKSSMPTGRLVFLLMGPLLLAFWAAPVIADSLEPVGEPLTHNYYFPSASFEPKAPALQGFDRCTHPTPGQMQLWWLDSPYAVVNLYIGGIHYPSSCENPAIDADWVQEVAAQGWSFTAVWVGPQAPCSEFLYRMKLDPVKAFTQGKTEAIAAVDAAESLGLPVDATLHYDIEGYPNESACRNAVASFLEGWSQQLHDMGYSSGAYGSPCRSYIADWAVIEPALDQVWIAHWTDDTYNPEASVWDVPCSVPNTLWAAEQRIKQYAGDHYETYGGIKLGIDSNVFDTNPITITTPITKPVSVLNSFAPTDSTSGWVLTDNKLLLTRNLGQTWTDRTPAGIVLLSAGFLDASRGWITGRTPAGIQVGHTADGGATWAFAPLDPSNLLAELPITNAWIDVVDENTLWISLKIASGSAFSIGRLFSSTDGGWTWSPRSIPIGAPVDFTSKTEGWSSGGPAGNETYRTSDGGISWEAAVSRDPSTEANLRNLQENTLAIRRSGTGSAWLLTQDGQCTGPKGAQICTQEQALFYTDNDGGQWLPIPLP